MMCSALHLVSARFRPCLAHANRQISLFRVITLKRSLSSAWLSNSCDFHRRSFPGYLVFGPRLHNLAPSLAGRGPHFREKVVIAVAVKNHFARTLGLFTVYPCGQHDYALVVRVENPEKCTGDLNSGVASWRERLIRNTEREGDVALVCLGCCA